MLIDEAISVDKTEHVDLMKRVAAEEIRLTFEE